MMSCGKQLQITYRLVDFVQIPTTHPLFLRRFFFIGILFNEQNVLWIFLDDRIGNLPFHRH